MFEIPDIPTKHNPIVRGSGLSCWVECAGCGSGKVAGPNGPYVGSAGKMKVVADNHDG